MRMARDPLQGRRIRQEALQLRQPHVRLPKSAFVGIGEESKSPRLDTNCQAKVPSDQAGCLERVDIQDSHGLATLIQAPFGSGGLGERSSSDFERSPVGSDGAAFAGQAHESRQNGGR